MAEKKAEKADIVAEAKKCFEQAESRESKNRQRMREAIKFSVELDQWPDAIKADRKDEGCPVFDKMNQYVRRITNEIRVNTPSLKFRPVDDKADKKIAEIYDGLVRHIFDQSKADSIFEKAGDYSTRGGFSYWRMVTEYCDPYSFDQDIKILPIPNCFSVLLGPHTDPTGADAKKGIVWEDMPLDEYKSTYPNTLPVNFESSNDGWMSEETIRVAEYYKVIPRKMKILLLDSGDVVEESEYKQHLAEYEKHKAAAEAALLQNPDIEIPIPAFPQVIKDRESVVNTVKCYKINGHQVLKEYDVLGTMIPIVKVVGNDYVLPDGELRTSGAVEAAMDPQRMHNYVKTKFIQQVALSPTAPYVGFIGQFKTKFNEWRNANRKNYSVLEVDPVLDENGALLPLPQRQAMPGIPTGWDRLGVSTEHDIEGAFGMYGASVGGPSKERSGVALEQQQEQGEIGSLHYKANIGNSILQTGKILLEWIPLIYDTERVARILGEDGTAETIFLNPEQKRAVEDRKDEFGKVIGKSYNLNVGKYDVRMSSGPSFMTKRQEGAAMMTEAIRGNPELLPLIGHLYFKILDVPYADDIAEILKATAPPAVQQVLNAKQDGKEPIPPKVVAMMRQIEQASAELQERAQAVQQAEQEAQKLIGSAQADKAAVSAANAKLAAEQRIFQAEIEKVMLQLQLEGRKIVDQVEAVVERMTPAQTPEGQPQQDNSQAQTQLMAEAVERVGETVSQAMAVVAEAVRPPAAPSTPLPP